MSETAIPSLDKVEDLFKTLVWDSMVSAGIDALFTAVPWLNAWPIGGAVRYLLLLFTDQMFSVVKVTVDLKAIELMNREFKYAYNTELLKLRIIALDKGVTSPEFLKERENAKKALARFVGYNAVP